MTNKNKVIEDFGEEWEYYDQSNLIEHEHKILFNNYFHIFPFNLIDKTAEGFDMGCGSGRWASLIAGRVKTLNCIEPSIKALNVAKFNLNKFKNCKFENSDIFQSSLKKGSQDFGYCLGVLHHIPDTKSGLKVCVEKLKKGAPFLVYLYYRFDNKPLWFKIIWKVSDIFRKLISKMPFRVKLVITFLIATIIYLPLAKLSYVLEKIGLNVKNIPLSSYRNTSLYTMKTDALDRFGTKLEHRFTKKEILEMMLDCDLVNIKFSEKTPFWVAVGEKK